MPFGLTEVAPSFQKVIDIIHKTVIGKNPVDSTAESRKSCAVIRSLVLSSKEQLIEEQRMDPELGDAYRYLRNPEESSVESAGCEN
ncbi:hypothetical protein TNCV_3350141 [Trichonephila clavipes]|nr:hypothetical protein TNCV_3350141 [Trichonephila clavipes]